MNKEQENKAVQENTFAAPVEVAIEDLPEMIEVDTAKLVQDMDFADRLEYLWNKFEDSAASESL